MRALGWYTLIFNLVVIALFVLHAAGRVDTPPFTIREDIAWMVFLLPVVVLGIMATRQRK
jgi:hypothetical protein